MLVAICQKTVQSNVMNEESEVVHISAPAQQQASNQSGKIGEILQRAQIISNAQLQTVLYDQDIYPDLRLGELLVLRGWINPKTLDFFLNYFQFNHSKPEEKKLGEYLLEAELISQEQLSSVLEEQQLNKIRFGSIAILKGYLKQATLDFFIEHFFAQEARKKNSWMTTATQTKVDHTDHNQTGYTSYNYSSEKESDTNDSEETQDPTEVAWIG